MEESQNHGILIAPPRPTDYFFAGVTKIETARVIDDWSPYLSEPEGQSNLKTDFLQCATMSAQHTLEPELNLLLSKGLLWDEAVNFFKQNKYIVNGKFNLSARFNAKLNGTDKTKGQYLNVVGDHFKMDGLVPESLWPLTPGMTWDEYYKDPSQYLKDLAKKALWFINTQYQWVLQIEIPYAVKTSPIQVATAVCPGWDSGQVVQKCDKEIQHATVVYGINPKTLNYLDFDQYTPFKQELAHNYNLPVNMQYVVSVKPITLRKGMQGVNVLTMQEKLNKLGYNLEDDSFFGAITETAVRNLQNKTNLISDGIAGPKTLAKLDEMVKPKTLLDIIIEIESNGDDNVEGDLTLKDHAYGCLQIRQGVCDDVNRKFNTNYISKNCLGNRSYSLEIWNKYWLVYPDKQTDEDKARTWNGGPGWKKIYFKASKTEAELKYCKNIDIYWSKVNNLLN